MTALKPIHIATRGSALALAQSNLILNQCRAAFPQFSFELKIIKTTAAHAAEKCAFSNDTLQSLEVIERFANGREPFIVLANLNSERALANAGKHDFRFQNRREQTWRNIRALQFPIRSDAITQSRDASESEHSGIKFGIFSQLLQTRENIPANVWNFQSGILRQQLRFATRAAGCDNGTARKIFDRKRWSVSAAIL